MESRAFALITGLFVVTLAAAIVVWAGWLAGDRVERKPYRVVSKHPVTGLNVQGSVRYRGISVGRVNRIALDPKDPSRILIDIEVDKDLPVTKGTYAQLGQEGITGIAYVHLLDEHKIREPLSTGADKPGEISLRPSFMDTVSDSAEGVLSEGREVLRQLRDLFNAENRKRIAATLESFEKTAADFRKSAERLPILVTRAEEGVQGIFAEKNRQHFASTLRQLDESSRELPGAVRDARELVGDMRKVVAQMNGMAGEAQAMAREARRLAGAATTLAEDATRTSTTVRSETLRQIEALADALEKNAGRMGRLASDLEREPSSLLWGRQPGRPGPGEPGFQQ